MNVDAAAQVQDTRAARNRDADHRSDARAAEVRHASNDGDRDAAARKVADARHAQRKLDIRA